MMKATRYTIFLMPLLGLFYNNAASQSIRGDTIYLEVYKVVTVKFISSPSMAELLPNSDVQEGSYVVNMMGKNDISILASKKAKDQELEVAEKDRKHLFILSYKEGSPARTVDLSSKKKVSERVAEANKNTSKALDEANSLYERAKNNPADPALWKDSEAKYQRLVNKVDGNDADFVKSRLEESRKQGQDLKDSQYGEAMKEGQGLYALKKWGDAKKVYEKALEVKPGDAQALKWIKLIDSVWTKEWVDRGDAAYNAKNYVAAKTYYQQAINIKPGYPSLQDKFNQARKFADPLISKIQSDKGIEFINENNFEEAKKALDSALFVTPGDPRITARLKIVNAELEKIKQEEQKDTAYQDILAKAKKLADKASTAQEYDDAIKEYEQAKALIPDRKFPRKKIAELTKKKNSTRRTQ